MSSPSSATLTLVPDKGDLVVWGDDAADQVTDRPAGTFVQVAPGGARQSLAIHADGTLAMWGTDATGITDPAPVGNFTDAAIGRAGAVAIRNDGLVVPWGKFVLPGFALKRPAVLDNKVATSVAIGGAMALAIADGTIVQWGADAGTEPQGPGYRVVAARHDYCLALRTGGVPAEPPAPADRGGGALVGWGGTMFPKGSSVPAHLPGWSMDGSGHYVHPGPFIAVAAGGLQRQLTPQLPHVLALTVDRHVVGWGADTWGEISHAPRGVRFSAIAAGLGFSLGLDDEGYLHYWGHQLGGTAFVGPVQFSTLGGTDGGPSILGTVPRGRYLAIGAGMNHAVAIADDNPPLGLSRDR